MVPTLAVVGNVQTLGLLIFADAQSQDRPDDHQNNEAEHAGPDRRGGDADGLNPKLMPHRSFHSETAEHRSSEEAGEQNTEDTADTMDGEDIKGIIELQDPLNDVGHDVTNDTGREADYQRA